MAETGSRHQRSLLSVSGPGSASGCLLFRLTELKSEAIAILHVYNWHDDHGPELVFREKTLLNVFLGLVPRLSEEHRSKASEVNG